MICLISLLLFEEESGFTQGILVCSSHYHCYSDLSKTYIQNIYNTNIIQNIYNQNLRKTFWFIVLIIIVMVFLILSSLKIFILLELTLFIFFSLMTNKRKKKKKKSLYQENIVHKKSVIPTSPSSSSNK